MKYNPIFTPILACLRRRQLFTILMAGILQVGPRQAHADLLLDFTGGSVNDFASAATAGWEFTLTTAVQLDALGFWDYNSDGLINSHTVGLWNSANPSTLLVSTLITSASTPVISPSSGRWLFNAVPSMILSPGTYVVGATMVPNDADLLRQSSTASMLSGATFVQGRDVSSATLLYPSPAAPALNDGLFGPNLQVSAIPEPDSALILLCALAIYFCPRMNRAQGASVHVHHLVSSPKYV
jgi:hypothetical protein